MSWVEAAWTVKRIEEDLNLSESIGSYIERINDLNDEIIDFNSKFQSIPVEDIESPLELMNKINQINEDINTTQDTFENILTNGQSFFDTALLEENNTVRPQYHSTENILKNTVWFILED